MIIAIDYDRTFTADPTLWRGFEASARQRGHTVVCVTARAEAPRSGPALPLGVRVVCAPNGFKRHAAEAAGIYVDIWIDDMPGVIEPQRLLSWDLAPAGTGEGREAEELRDAA